MFEDMKVTIGKVSDEMPNKRTKYIHSVGNVGTV